MSVREAEDGIIVVPHLAGRIVVWWPDSDVLGAEVMGPVGCTGLARVVDDRILVAATGRGLEIPLDMAAWRSIAGDGAGDDVDPVRWRFRRRIGSASADAVLVTPPSDRGCSTPSVRFPSSGGGGRG